jgi:hypothetical protein
MRTLTLKTLPLLLLAGACAHPPAPGSFRADPEPFVAEGSAPLDERNLGASRDRAAQDAEKAAVRRAAELFLDDTARAESYAALETGLLRTPGLYVAKRKILSEGRDGAAYRVSLRVWVRHDLIASALRGLNLAGPAAAGPAAAFAQRGGADKAFSAAFREAFSRRSAVTLKDYPFASDEALLAGPDSGLLQAASAAGAQLLFSASASAASSGAGLDTGFHPARAEASLKVYEVAGGRELLSLSSQANAVDSSQPAAFAKALASAGELLGQEAAGKASRLIKADAAVRIKFLGLAGLEAAEKLREQLQRSGLTGLRLETYAEGAAVFLAVPLSGDPQQFASIILRTDTFGLELEAAGPAGIVFSAPR